MSYFGVNRKTTKNPLYTAGYARAGTTASIVDPFSKKQANNKWLPFVNPIAQEAKEPVIRPPAHLAAKEKAAQYQAKLASATAEEKVAIYSQQHKGTDEAIEVDMNEKYRAKFSEFLRGVAPDEEYKRVGWDPKTFKETTPTRPYGGRAKNEPLSLHPTVIAYLDSTVDSSINYQRDLAKLRNKAASTGMHNMSIDECWKLYKYYILGIDDSAPPDPLGFLGSGPSSDTQPPLPTPMTAPPPIPKMQTSIKPDRPSQNNRLPLNEQPSMAKPKPGGGGGGPSGGGPSGCGGGSEPTDDELVDLYMKIHPNESERDKYKKLSPADKKKFQEATLESVGSKIDEFRILAKKFDTIKKAMQKMGGRDDDIHDHLSQILLRGAHDTELDAELAIQLENERQYNKPTTPPPPTLTEEEEKQIREKQEFDENERLKAEKRQKRQEEKEKNKKAMEEITEQNKKAQEMLDRRLDAEKKAKEEEKKASTTTTTTATTTSNSNYIPDSRPVLQTTTSEPRERVLDHMEEQHQHTQKLTKEADNHEKISKQLMDLKDKIIHEHGENIKEADLRRRKMIAYVHDNLSLKSIAGGKAHKELLPKLQELSEVHKLLETAKEAHEAIPMLLGSHDEIQKHGNNLYNTLQLIKRELDLIDQEIAEAWDAEKKEINEDEKKEQARMAKYQKLKKPTVSVITNKHPQLTYL